MCEENKELGFKDKINKDLYLMQYNESAKVIDFCKAQQWYTTALGVGINYGLIIIATSHTNELPTVIKAFVFFIMIVITMLIPVVGAIIHISLAEKAIKHRNNVNMLRSNKYLKAPNGLKEMFFRDSPKNDSKIRDYIYVGVFVFTLLLSSLITLIIVIGSIVNVLNYNCIHEFFKCIMKCG